MSASVSHLGSVSPHVNVPDKSSVCWRCSETHDSQCLHLEHYPCLVSQWRFWCFKCVAYGNQQPAGSFTLGAICRNIAAHHIYTPAAMAPTAIFIAPARRYYMKSSTWSLGKAAASLINLVTFTQALFWCSARHCPMNDALNWIHLISTGIFTLAVWQSAMNWVHEAAVWQRTTNWVLEPRGLH